MTKFYVEQCVSVGEQLSEAVGFALAAMAVGDVPLPRRVRVQAWIVQPSGPRSVGRALPSPDWPSAAERRAGLRLPHATVWPSLETVTAPGRSKRRSSNDAAS